jgi:hypothetical protein
MKIIQTELVEILKIFYEKYNIMRLTVGQALQTRN